MNIKSVLVLLAFGLSACSSGRYAGVPKEYHALIDRTIATAGDNAKELKKALKEVPHNEREGMAFLISYMPERDAKSLSADFLLENVQYAYKARAEFPWAKEVPDSVFLNDVVAYANLNENRESWRKDFYERFKKYVAPCKTMREAIDSVNKNELHCDHLFYNETTGYGFATKRALMVDYSQKDTLYMHADSVKLYTFNIKTDSVYRKVHAYNHVRAYRNDVQAVCDSLVFNSQDSCMTMYRDPILWNLGRQILGEVIHVYMNDSTVRKAEVIGQALSVEKCDEKNHYNQISSNRMDAFFTDGALRRAEAIGTVKSLYYNADSKDSTLSELNYMETDTLRMYMSPTRELEKIWASKATGTMYPITQIPPEKYQLPEFAWFDYVRPKDKDDVFNWRGKAEGTELKEQPRREAPLQRLE